jgi:hypothetical protein
MAVDSDASPRMDDGTLREKARQVIRAGTLPNRRPDHMWGGPGVGADCTICQVPVQQDEFEFELEFARNGEAPDRYHVHIPCFTAWESERASAAGDQR